MRSASDAATGHASRLLDPCAGMTDAFVWDVGTPRERVTGGAETLALLEEIDAKFKRECTHLIYNHQVQGGTVQSTCSFALSFGSSSVEVSQANNGQPNAALCSCFVAFPLRPLS